MAEVTDRTPMVIIELQLRPAPPPEAKPHWWGDHMLRFSLNGESCWERHIPEAGRSSEAARVELRGGFGWVLVLTLTHLRAREALQRLALRPWAGDGE